MVLNEKSPVPLPPESFPEQVQSLHFTSKRTDTDVVIQLYARIFPKLAEHEHLTVGDCWCYWELLWPPINQRTHR